MISITINNVFCQVNELDDERIIHKIDKELSYYINGYQFIRSFQMGHWDGKQHLLNKSLQFQTGLLPIVEDILKKNHIDYCLIDNRKELKLGKKIKIAPNYYVPRDYQTEIVDVCLKEKCGLIKAATGCGKTFCISMLIAATNVKTVVYVISIDLLYQTQAAIQEALGIKVGIIGDGRCEINKINVALPWTIIHSYEKDYEPFDEDDNNGRKEIIDQPTKNEIRAMVEGAQMFVIDEVQYLAASSFQLIAKCSKNARYRLGFSGTPWRDDGADLALQASTGKQLIDIDATTLINKNVLVPPKIFFFEVPELDNYGFHSNKSYPQVYDNFIVQNQIRNEMIIESVEKLFNNHRKTLILIRRKKHGLELLKMIPNHIKAYYLNGDANNDERQAVKDLFNNDGVDVILASTIFDTGIDLPKLDALILAGGGKSSTRALQRIGRVIRSHQNKKDAIVVDFIDSAPYLYEHSKKRWSIYKTEEAFQIKLPGHFEW